MKVVIDKTWFAYSKQNQKFNIHGYSTIETDYRDEALEAIKILAKHLNEPIPSDIELVILSPF